MRGESKTAPPTNRRLREGLREWFGYTDFRDGQEVVMPTLLDGRAALAIFPTGAGKSPGYQLPALLLPGLALVVSQLSALMKDQVDGLLEPLGAPYTSFRWRFLTEPERILAGHTPARQDFLRRLFAVARRGPRWDSLETAAAAEQLGQPAERLRKALPYLAEAGRSN